MTISLIVYKPDTLSRDACGNAVSLNIGNAL